MMPFNAAAPAARSRPSAPVCCQGRFRAALLLGAIAAAPLAGCGLYQPISSDDREANRACTAEADRVFAAQNRYLLSERDQSNTPYSGSALPSNPSAGLSDRYEQEQMVDKCMARTAGEPTGTPATAPPAKP
jgi:hypothetical protein